MRTSLQFDKETSVKLGILAKHEDRTKIDEIRFLIKKEIEHLGLNDNTKRQKKAKVVKK